MNHKLKFLIAAVCFGTTLLAQSQQLITPSVRRIEPSGTVSLTMIANAPRAPRATKSLAQLLIESKRRGTLERTHESEMPDLKSTGWAPSAKLARKAASNPQVVLSFEALNGYSASLASGYTYEPPDQGLCVGNGMVVESVNDAIIIYDATSGNALTSAVSLESFYGEAESTDFVFDPSCHFDSATQRWFHLVTDLGTDPKTGQFTGASHLDLAVSQTADPRGTWTVYRIDTEDNGQNGTPDHGCSYGYCYGDFPHLGADRYGIYIDTNEWSLFGPEFKSANIYALSKQALVNGAAVTAVQFDTVGAAAGHPGLSVHGAVSSAFEANEPNDGTEFFLSSDANPNTGNTTGRSNRLFLWKLSNTSSLDSAKPSLTFTNRIVPVSTYALPPYANQKGGDIPLAECLAVDCLGLGFTVPNNGVQPLDSGRSGVTRIYYADGKLWASLGTAVSAAASQRVGVEWFIIDPQKGTVKRQGYLAFGRNNLTFPTVGVKANGKGILTFTVVGEDYHPSPGYAQIDENGVGPVHIVAEGAGPADGATEYLPPPRWGDYSETVIDGDSIWIGSEMISQTCDYQQFLGDFTCGGTRTPFTNWSTRLTKLIP